LAIYKRGRGFELGATEKQTQVVVRAGLEPETAGLRVRRADHSATLPPLQRVPCNVTMAACGQVKSENSSLPIAVHLSETRLLKFPIDG